jgi:hypothetical protein
MKFNLPHALTWGTASTAVVSAALLACVGGIVPGAARNAAPGFGLRPNAGTGVQAGAARSPASRRGDDRASGAPQ